MSPPIRNRALRLALHRLPAVIAAFCALSALSTSSAGASTQNPRGHLLGFVRSTGHARAALAASSTLLSYHGGPVMHSNATKVVFWGPPAWYPARYQTTISSFLSNVARDSGKPTNVYAITSQYADAAGPASYRSTFAGTTQDSTAYPASGCRASGRACLTSAQLERELAALITRAHLPSDMAHAYLVMTPPGVAVCTDGSGAQCSTNAFCGYHSNALPGGALYAALPFPTVGCGSGESPNGNPADPAIDTLSHENIEMITDPLGTGWYTSRGVEVADLCDWFYGTTLGGISGSRYNQVIGTGTYFLQGEWSNARARCAVPSRIAPTG